MDQALERDMLELEALEAPVVVWVLRISPLNISAEKCALMDLIRSAREFLAERAQTVSEKDCLGTFDAYLTTLATSTDPRDVQRIREAMCSHVGR